MNELTRLFYDPKTGLGSLFNFMRRAKEAGFGAREIIEFLHKQETLQLNKERGKVNYFPLWGHGIGSYQMDIMFQDDPRNNTRQIPILNVINVNTRMLYSYLLKTRTTAEVLRALTRWLRDVKEPPRFLQSDNEKAFTSESVRSLMNEHNVAQGFVVPENHRGQATIERVNQTLRRLFVLYEDALKRPWTDGFEDLVWNYNHRPHTSTGKPPTQTTEGDGMLGRLEQYLLALRDFNKFKVGDRVRKAVNKSTRFDKGKVKWSSEVYTVTGTNGHHLWGLSDGSFQKHYDLQLVRGVEKANEKPSLEPVRAVVRKAKKVKRDLRKEGVTPANVTEEQRKKQAPTAFVAEPAPNPRTLPRERPTKSVATTKSPADPTSVKIIEVREKGRYYFGRVGERLPNGNFVVNFDDGSEGEYSPADVLRFKWTPNAAQRARLKKDPTWSPI